MNNIQSKINELILLKNQIATLENTINAQAQKRQEKKEKLKNNEKQVKTLNEQKKSKSDELEKIRKGLEFVETKNILILKDELVATLMILAEILIMYLTFPNIYLGLIVCAINWVGTATGYPRYKDKNQKLIDYYKKVNGIEENKNVTITTKKLKECFDFTKFRNLEKTLAEEINDINLKIKSLNEYICGLKKELSMLDNEAKNNIAMKNYYEKTKNEIVNQMIEEEKPKKEDNQKETEVNKGYCRVKAIN